MDDILEFSLPVAAAYGYALAAWPILRLPHKISLVFSTCVGIAVLSCPLLIPADKVIFRAIAAFLYIELMFKMLDYSRQERRRASGVYGFVDYLKFVIPFPVLLVVFRRRERRLPMDRPRNA